MSAPLTIHTALPRLWLGFLGLLPVAASAQNLLGLTTSSNGGIHRAYQNPAWLADSPHRFYVSLGAVNIHANNNFVRYKAPFSLLRLVTGQVPNQYRQPNGGVQFKTEYTEEIQDGKPKNGTVWGEFRGPALQVAVGERTVIGLSSRLRASGQVWGASEQLLSALRASLSSDVLYSIPTRNNAFSTNTNTYAEVAATLGHTLFDEDGMSLMVGVTAKYLVGFTSGYFVNQGLSYEILPDPLIKSRGYMNVKEIVGEFGYTSYLQNQNLSLRSLVNGNPPGRGVGFDLGLAYRMQPDPEGATLKAGIALTDIGSIRYTGDAYNINQTNLRFVSEDFDEVRNSEQVINVIRQKLKVNPASNLRSFASGLPTSLNLNVDYERPGGLGLQVAYWQDMRGNDAVAMHQPSVVAVVPRFDSRWAGASLPISYVNGAAQVGLSLRAGPFWAGSDNVFGLLGTSNNGISPRGVDVYFGMAMGFGSRTGSDNGNDY
ncbi:hypothetical protein F7231_17945 [Fibrella aestuarina]|uniref:DUF5723 domain-containing protein n=1 Tax=Fibrivirga algicola TaxID=2950420 RepID=A0ABX0QLM5_9BACT|nr:hypothetical protein [Fibrivirga algicola]